jgi:hypothetical protein
MANDALTVQVLGAPELRRALRGMRDELRDLSRLHKTVAEIVRAQMANMAPRDSGQLAASLRASGTRKSATVKSTLIYAPVQHYGWAAHGISPTLFGDRAREASLGAVDAAYRSGIDDIIHRIDHR